MTDQSPELKALLDVIDNRPRDPSKVVQICHFMDQLEYAYDKYTDTLPKPRTCPAEGCDGNVTSKWFRDEKDQLSGQIFCDTCKVSSAVIKDVKLEGYDAITQQAWQSFYRNETGYPE